MQCTLHAYHSAVTAVAITALDCTVISTVFDWLSSEINSDLMRTDNGLQTAPDLLKHRSFHMYNYDMSRFMEVGSE